MSHRGCARPRNGLPSPRSEPPKADMACLGREKCRAADYAAHAAILTANVGGRLIQLLPWETWQTRSHAMALGRQVAKYALLVSELRFKHDDYDLHRDRSQNCRPRRQRLN